MHKRERLPILRDAFAEGALAAGVRAQVLVLRRRTMLLGGAVAISLFASSPVLAATSCGNTAKGASQILNIMSFIAEALVGIGGATFLLMVALGGCLIIFGVTPRCVYKGHEMIKQAMIGLGIIAVGLVIKFVLVVIVFSQHPGESKLPTTC